MNAETIVAQLLEDEAIHQKFLTPDGRYFNFKFNGLASTTWTWDGLLKNHPNGIDILGWWVDPNAKKATNLKDKRVIQFT